MVIVFVQYIHLRKFGYLLDDQVSAMVKHFDDRYPIKRYTYECLHIYMHTWILDRSFLDSCLYKLAQNDVKQHKGNSEVHVPWSSTKVICSIRMFASSTYLFVGERIALAAAARTPKGINIISLVRYTNIVIYCRVRISNQNTIRLL